MKNRNRINRILDDKICDGIDTLNEVKNHLWHAQQLRHIYESPYIDKIFMLSERKNDLLKMQSTLINLSMEKLSILKESFETIN